jgi:LacI family transcriptional regulator
MTIKDIARESGYAVGTVSRVLNNHPHVSEKARRAILAVVESRNFTPNSNARLLKQQLSSGVAVIVKGAHNMLFAGILEQLQAEIRKRGFPTFVTYLDESENEVEQARRLCQERKPLGILFLGGNLDHFRQDFSQISIPCALITSSAGELPLENLSSVTTNDREAAAFCINYLYNQGHRNIGILGGQITGSDPSFARLQGCRQAFADLGLPFQFRRQYQIARFSMSSGYEAMERLLDSFPEVTAVFAFSDVMAMGALRALRDRGKRVPQDISLLGFDGIELGQYSEPRLTTLRQDDQALAQRGAELLLSRIESPAPRACETVGFTLLHGESVCPPAPVARNPRVR